MAKYKDSKSIKDLLEAENLPISISFAMDWEDIKTVGDIRSKTIRQMHDAIENRRYLFGDNQDVSIPKFKALCKRIIQAKKNKNTNNNNNHSNNNIQFKAKPDDMGFGDDNIYGMDAGNEFDFLGGGSGAGNIDNYMDSGNIDDDYNTGNNNYNDDYNGNYNSNYNNNNAYMNDDDSKIGSNIGSSGPGYNDDNNFNSNNNSNSLDNSNMIFKHSYHPFNEYESKINDDNLFENGIKMQITKMIQECDDNVKKCTKLIKTSNNTKQVIKQRLNNIQKNMIIELNKKFKQMEQEIDRIYDDKTKKLDTYKKMNIKHEQFLQSNSNPIGSSTQDVLTRFENQRKTWKTKNPNALKPVPLNMDDINSFQNKLGRSFASFSNNINASYFKSQINSRNNNNNYINTSNSYSNINDNNYNQIRQPPLQHNNTYPSIYQQQHNSKKKWYWYCDDQPNVDDVFWMEYVM